MSQKTPVPVPEEPPEDYDIDVEEELEDKRQRNAFSEKEAIFNDFDIMDEYYAPMNAYIGVIDLENVGNESFLQLYDCSLDIVSKLSKERTSEMTENPLLATRVAM